MGLKLTSVQIILPALLETQAKPGARILLLGVQDLYFTYDQAKVFLLGLGVKMLEVPEAERRKTESFAFVPHGDWWQFKHFLHQETFFRMLGFGPDQLDTLDVSGFEHAGIIHDMNLPIPAGVGPYDLVIDAGTLEHVFNQRQALWNMADLVAVGGQAVHFMPSNMLDHGFYNLNSTLLADFYRQAGWEQVELTYIASPRADTGDSTLYVRIAPGALDAPPGGFWLGLLGRFRKPEGTSKPVAAQALYESLHDAWTRQSRAQSTHEAPPEQPGDAWRKRVARWKAAWRFGLARRIAARLPGEVVLVREPPRSPSA